MMAATERVCGNAHGRRLTQHTARQPKARTLHRNPFSLLLPFSEKAGNMRVPGRKGRVWEHPSTWGRESFPQLSNLCPHLVHTQGHDGKEEGLLSTQ